MAREDETQVVSLLWSINVWNTKSYSLWRNENSKRPLCRSEVRRWSARTSNRTQRWKQSRNSRTQIKRLARGSSVVIGDLNARHKNWDNTTTVQGRRLNAFCAQANFKVLSPPEPSCRTAQGRSYVDLALVRNLKQKDITVYDVEGQSDHAPVKYELLQSEPQDVDFIPLNLVQNHEYQRRANWAYWSTLPDLIEPIEKSSSPEELTKATFDFAKASLAPWAALRPPSSEAVASGMVQGVRQAGQAAIQTSQAHRRLQ